MGDNPCLFLVANGALGENLLDLVKDVYIQNMYTLYTVSYIYIYVILYKKVAVENVLVIWVSC